MTTSELAARPVVHCLGCGRAARTLLRLWHERGLIQVGTIVNRSRNSAEAAVGFIGAGNAATQLPAFAAGEGVLLGVPEAALAATAQAQSALIQNSAGMAPAFAFHLSASQAGSVLSPLAERVASCHPALAFGDPAHALNQFAGSWCVIEGDEVLAARLKHWCESADAKVLVAAQLDKKLYHAAAMSASNLVLGVLSLARNLATTAGLPTHEAQQLLTELALRNVHAAREHGLAKAFTGPMERGDTQTIAGLLDHLNATPQVPASDVRAWLDLLLQCLPLVEEKGRLDSSGIQVLQATIEAAMPVSERD